MIFLLSLKITSGFYDSDVWIRGTMAYVEKHPVVIP